MGGGWKNRLGLGADYSRLGGYFSGMLLPDPKPDIGRLSSTTKSLYR